MYACIAVAAIIFMIFVLALCKGSKDADNHANRIK